MTRPHPISGEHNASSPATDLTAALARIDQVIEQISSSGQVPGIALAITDREGLLAVRSYGHANIDAKTPVKPGTLFEIGSIGKSFTAIVFMQLAAEGIVDLHVPVQTYLPWFEVQSEYGPITLHHLLTHTAGIISGSDHVPDPRYELWTLRNTRAYAAPGEQFHYSNLGYKALGLILEQILQKPYARIIEERIFRKLGMSDACAEITSTMRPQLAVGYASHFDDRPRLPAHGFVPATWLESDTGDGCISTHATDLATYLRMFLNYGTGEDGSLITADLFALMRNPHTGPSPRPTYGYALVRASEAETNRFGHSGGMVGYNSNMNGDLESGLGVVVLCNASGPVAEISEFALQTIAAARAGEDLPEIPNGLGASEDAFAFANAADYAGTFQSETGTLEVLADGDHLTLVSGDIRVPLQRFGKGRIADTFIADHPDFVLAPLRFVREATEGTLPEEEEAANGQVPAGPVTEIVHGTTWYCGEHYDGPTTFEYPQAWDAYAGHYRSHGPWFTSFRIGILKGELVMTNQGYEQALVPEGAGFRVGKGPDAPEWITFDAIVDGRALVLRFETGAEFARFFTP